MKEQGDLSKPGIRIQADTDPLIGVLPLGWMPGYVMSFSTAQRKGIEVAQKYQEKQDKKDKDDLPKPPPRPNAAAMVGRLLLGNT